MWKSMRLWHFNIFLILLIICVSCGQDYNSNTNDARYANSSYDVSTPFGAAQAVLSDRCFSCHGTWANYTDSQAWINSGQIAPGSWSSSTMYTRIKNYGGDMPPSPASELTSAELTALATWVNGL